jgi:tetratricopeptide (TPR) repeat protein
MLERASMRRTELAFELHATLGRARIGLGHAAAAVAALEQALADAEAAHGKESTTLNPLLAAIADGLLELGRRGEARAFADRAFAIVRKQSGDGGFDVAQARVDVARVALAQGRAAEALAAVEASEPAVLAAVGEAAPVLGEARRIRGEALLALGRLDEARAALTSSLTIADGAGSARAERDAIASALGRASSGRASSGRASTP